MAQLPTTSLPLPSTSITLPTVSLPTGSTTVLSSVVVTTTVSSSLPGLPTSNSATSGLTLPSLPTGILSSTTPIDSAHPAAEATDGSDGGTGPASTPQGPPELDEQGRNDDGGPTVSTHAADGVGHVEEVGPSPAVHTARHAPWIGILVGLGAVGAASGVIIWRRR